MTDIGPGDMVEAIDTKPRFWNKGQKFMVTAMIAPVGGCGHGELGQHVCPGMGIRLLNLPNTRPGQWWCAGNFKPLPRQIDSEGVDREETIYA